MSNEAIFDTLYITNSFKNQQFLLYAHYIHIMAYLACILSLYDGDNSSDWQYSFLATVDDVPFSADIANAINFLDEKGYIVRQKDKDYKISQIGENTISEFVSYHSYESRKHYLEAACTCLTTLPLSIFKRAIKQEPGLSRIYNYSQDRYLIQEAESAELYTQFGILLKHIGKVNNLFLPASVWLMSLANSEYSSNVVNGDI